MAEALIPFTQRELSNSTVETVNARDLHAFLEVKTQFSHWIQRRIETYGFIEDIDFCVAKNGYGAEQVVDYFVSLSMAKELSMVERTAKGKEARHYFLACERKALGMQESSQQVRPLPALPIQDQIAALDTTVNFLDRLGMLDARDKLMFADLVRTEVQRQYRQGSMPGQQALPEPAGFFLADRVRTLGYVLTRKQEASLMSSGLARAVAREHLQQHGEKAIQSQRFVDGAIRPVYWYTNADGVWIDTLIQTWCARLGLTADTRSPDTGE